MVKVYEKLAKQQYPDFDFSGYSAEILTIMLEDIDYDKIQEKEEMYDDWTIDSVYDVPLIRTNIPKGYIGVYFTHLEKPQTFFMVKTDKSIQI